jgi:hypothetical protein
MTTDGPLDRMTSGWDGRHLSLFVLGVVLILLGLTAGLDLPVVKSVSSTGGARAVSVALGVAAVAVAFVRADRRPAVAADPSPDLARVFTTLSFGQQRLLGIVRMACAATGVAGQDALERAAKPMSWSAGEVYYRLENLVLLGFLEKHPAGENSAGMTRFTYRQTEAARRLGDTLRGAASS